MWYALLEPNIIIIMSEEMSPEQMKLPGANIGSLKENVKGREVILTRWRNLDDRFDATRYWIDYN